MPDIILKLLWIILPIEKSVNISSRYLRLLKESKIT